jgi:TRAP-type C4-dicarboxylate transport system permease small subunit
MPMGAPTAGIPTPSTSSSQVPHREEHPEHRGWIYAAIAMIAAVLVLGVMGAFQYAQTRDTASTAVVTSGVPAEFAGVSLPQAMRLADAAAVTSR